MQGAVEKRVLGKAERASLAGEPGQSLWESLSSSSPSSSLKKKTPPHGSLLGAPEFECQETPSARVFPDDIPSSALCASPALKAAVEAAQKTVASTARAIAEASLCSEHSHSPSSSKTCLRCRWLKTYRTARSCRGLQQLLEILSPQTQWLCFCTLPVTAVVHLASGQLVAVGDPCDWPPGVAAPLMASREGRGFRVGRSAAAAAADKTASSCKASSEGLLTDKALRESEALLLQLTASARPAASSASFPSSPASAGAGSGISLEEGSLLQICLCLTERNTRGGSRSAPVSQPAQGFKAQQFSSPTALAYPDPFEAVAAEDFLQSLFFKAPPLAEMDASGLEGASARSGCSPSEASGVPLRQTLLPSPAVQASLSRAAAGASVWGEVRRQALGGGGSGCRGLGSRNGSGSVRFASRQGEGEGGATPFRTSPSEASSTTTLAGAGLAASAPKTRGSGAGGLCCGAGGGGSSWRRGTKKPVTFGRMASRVITSDEDLFDPEAVTYGSHCCCGQRTYNEDRVFVQSKLSPPECPNLPSSAMFFAVYDGHNGEEAVDFVCGKLHLAVCSQTKYAENDLVGALRAAFAEIDQELSLQATKNEGKDQDLDLFPISSGTTACTALLKNSTLYIANIGDRAFGGFCKVTGEKLKGLISEPDVFVQKIQREDEFLVLACDGIFDVLSSQEVISVARQKLRAGEAPDSVARELCQIAQRRRSLDNLSVVLVMLRDPKEAVQTERLRSGEWGEPPPPADFGGCLGSALFFARFCGGAAEGPTSLDVQSRLRGGGPSRLGLAGHNRRMFRAALDTTGCEEE